MPILIIFRLIELVFGWLTGNFKHWQGRPMMWHFCLQQI